MFLPPALATGKLKIITGAMAREVLTDTNGLATGVSYVNTSDAREYTVRSKAVVLAASAGESARLMFNSKSPRHPNGLSNTSGVLGKYLNGLDGPVGRRVHPEDARQPAHNEDGVGGMHLYMPWWLDDKKLDFPRGYHIEIGGGRDMPGYGFGGGIAYMPGSNGGGYGTALKDGLPQGLRRHGRLCRPRRDGAQRGLLLRDRSEHGGQVGDSGAALPMEVGRPRSCRPSTCRKRSARSSRRWAASLSGAMPGKDHDYGLEAGGRIIHEAGCTRMGSDPKTSVLNESCQAHDAKNVVVADAGPFVTNADKNCTWTIMALSWRTRPAPGR